MTPPFDILVQDFFCRRLIDQQGVSPRTIEAYRDTFRLLLAYLPQRLGKPVPALRLDDLDAPTILAFFGSPGDRARQRAAHSQSPTVRLALLRAICRIAGSDHLAIGPAGPGHPGEALHQADARLPDP